MASTDASLTASLQAANISSATGIKIDEPNKTLVVTSGELLWGQYHCLLEGSMSSSHDGPSNPSPLTTGGTILWHDRHFRLAARKGEWMISKLFIDEDFVGFIVYHEDVDPKEYAKMASDVGISLGNDHGNKKITYINRYDWAWHHNHEMAQNFVDVSTIASDPPCVYDDDEEEEGDETTFLSSGCCVLLDAAYFEQLLKLYNDIRSKSESLPVQSFSFVTDNASSKFPDGVHLTAPNIEYELAWIGFSGNQHPDFPGSDECVAFVYDTAYSGLDSRRMRCATDEVPKLYVDDQVAKVFE